MTREVQADLVATLADIAGGENVIAVSVGSDLVPVVLSLKQPPDYRRQPPSGASFAKKRAAKPNTFSVHHLVGDVWWRVALEPTTENYYAVQPIGKDKWLLVRGRASGINDANVSLYSSEGQRLGSFHGGDGIQDVQVAEDGDIWISYFDEGVYGDGDLGQEGLVRLNERGEVGFRYSKLYDRVPVIDDCYALNVCSQNEVWLYYYNAFPLVHLRNGDLARCWPKMPVHGAHAFAIDRERVLFAGSYDKRNSLFLVNLGSLTAEELRPLDADGKPLRSFRGLGWRSRLFLVTETALYGLDLSNL